MKPDFTDHPDLQALDAWIEARGLRFEIRPAAFEAVDSKEILIRALDQPDLVLTVFDEYGDARPDNPWLAAILTGRAFEAMDEAFEVWARAEMIEADAAARAVFDKTRAARRLFEAAHGAVPEIGAGMDFELNAGPIQLLRRWGQGR